jgi:hypothetical protein
VQAHRLNLLLCVLTATAGDAKATTDNVMANLREALHL